MSEGVLSKSTTKRLSSRKSNRNSNSVQLMYDEHLSNMKDEIKEREQFIEAVKQLDEIIHQFQGNRRWLNRNIKMLSRNWLKLNKTGWFQ